jgi:hypothetical protein
MKIRNKKTGVETEVNCINPAENTIRLENGEFEKYPSLWAENASTIATQNEVATEFLVNTGDWELV